MHCIANSAFIFNQDALLEQILDSCFHDKKNCEQLARGDVGGGRSVRTVSYGRPDQTTGGAGRAPCLVPGAVGQ